MAMSKPSRKIFVVISALAVMAVSLFLIVSTLYSPPIPSIPVQPTVIVFEPDSVEMGELSPDVAKTVVIRLRNVSDHPLLITTAVGSCGCTTSTWPNDPIAPGEFAEAGVTVKPSKEQAGETLMKTVTYMVEDAGPVTVFVRGQVSKAASETAAPQPPSGAAVSSATAAPPSTAKQSPFRRSNPTVFPGSRLPFPNLATWVQGEPATAWAPGTVYVFEFFSTTCSHCKE
ncbi:MAG: DUF1573 domain-containing protein, partial [Proteobacteria bacterium]|nr:DUF1573 domain-containing protein [Pseudomonadota bacterium]